MLGILHKEGHLSMSEISRKIFIPKPNLTPLIVRLMDQGVVERLSDSKDHRIINVSLTARGRKID